MSNYKEKYLKYKEKYSKLKNQFGSAPSDLLIVPPIVPLSLVDLPSEPLLDNIDVLSQIKLATVDKRYRDAFSRKYSGYNSTFAPDIIIINNNVICNNQPGCNKFITHYRIKDILNRNKDFLKKFFKKNKIEDCIPIPKDGENVIPILKPILLNTIRTNNKSDADFLVSIGVIIKTINDFSFQRQGLNEVYIPSCITRIGIAAFAGNNLVDVQIPSSVTNIDDSAFYKNKLVTVQIPSSVTSIGKDAFAGNDLVSVQIPDSVTTISDGAFLNNKLKTVRIPQNIISIGDNTFSYNELEEVNLPDLLITIGKYAFANNKLKTIQIPPNVEVIEEAAFTNNLLIDINIPDSVTDIGLFAFKHNRLTTVNIGINVFLTIGWAAFYNNPIKNVTIPDRFIKLFADLFNNPSGITFNLLS